MGVVFVLFVFVTLFTGILCFMKNYKKIKLDIPAPQVLPIIGHAHLMLGLDNEGSHLKIIVICGLLLVSSGN